MERKVLEAGCCFERVRTDYGIDADVLTFDDRGGLESGLLRFQLKATDALRTVEAGTRVAQRVLVVDLKAWLLEVLPVILVVYDAKEDRAFWLDVQEYVREQKLDATTARTVTVLVPMEKLLTVAAIHQARTAKNRAVIANWERRV